MAFFSPGGWSFNSLRRDQIRAGRSLTILLVVIALVASACGSSESTLAIAAAPEPEAEVLAEPELSARSAGSPGVESAPQPAASQPEATATATAPASPEVEPAREAPPVEAITTYIATATDAVTTLVAYDAPGGSVIPFEFGVPNPHQFGGPQVLMVTQGSPEDEWVQVQLPIRPNGQTGWIDASLYEFSQTQVRAEVNLSERSIVVYDGTEIIAETRAVIGSPATPTPLGTFFITAKRANPPEESFLGPWALALSAFSEVHETFGGGLPVIAIHGTTRPDQVGDARSNGCLRIPNDVVTLLAENVPLGAPVTISA